MSQATADDVATELTKLGYVTQVLRADPPNARVDAVNVWAGNERFPTDTVWAPMAPVAKTSRLRSTDAAQGPNFMWTWGPNFDYSAPADASAAEIAAQIVATVLS